MSMREKVLKETPQTLLFVGALKYAHPTPDTSTVLNLPSFPAYTGTTVLIS